jgi:hypothetical protein
MTTAELYAQLTPDTLARLYAEVKDAATQADNYRTTRQLTCELTTIRRAGEVCIGAEFEQYVADAIIHGIA